MLWNLFFTPLCQASVLSENLKKSALDQLESLGFTVSQDMTDSFFDIVGFSIQNPSEFKEVALEMKVAYSSKMPDVYRMVDDLLVGKNTDLFNEMLEFSKKSQKSEYLKTLLGKIQRLYFTTIAANHDFSVYKITNDSSMYMKIPLEYRALGYMAISEAKMMLNLFTMFNQNKSPLMDFYNYISNGATGKAFGKAFNFIAEDIKKNLTENPEMAQKHQIIKSFYGSAKTMILSSFGQIAVGNMNVDDKLSDLMQKFVIFQSELNNIVANSGSKQEIL